MSQRSGADRFPSTGSLSPARTSPFICFADFFNAIVLLVIGIYNKKSVWAIARYQQNVMGNTRAGMETNLLEGIPSAGLIIFALVPLPVSIKLFAYEGIPLTQFLGSLFFAAYIIDILFKILAFCYSEAGDPELALPEQKKIERILDWVPFLTYFLMYALQLGLWIWMSTVITKHMGASIDHTHKGIDRSGFSAFFGSIFSIIEHGVGNILAAVANLLLVLVFVALPVFAGTLLIMAIDWSLVLLGRDVQAKRLEQVAETELVQEAPPASQETSDEEAPQEPQSNNAAKAPEQTPPKGKRFLHKIDGGLETRRALLISFAIWNLVYGALFYRYVYDPTGTYRPLWLDVFGA